MSHIRLEVTGPVAALLLCRPDQRNALTPEMLAEFNRALGAIPSAARCLLLAGEGAVFCAGFDLSLCHAHPDGSVMRVLLRGLSEAVAALRALPIPVVIGAQGAAIAGGCALLGGADFIVADSGAKFGYPVTRLGVSPAVSAPFLAQSIGPGRARERLLDPTLIDGVEALRIGLVHRLVDQPDQVRQAARAEAVALCEKPQEALRATRRWLDELSGLGPWRGRALAASQSLAGSPEERSRIEAAVRKA